ncbi:hypothetical protein CLF_113072, partial [Clonorchis sinensis]
YQTVCAMPEKRMHGPLTHELWTGSILESRYVAESTELCGLAVAAIACENPSVLMARSANVVLMSDVVAQYALHVPGEPAPPNYRSLKVLLRLSAYRLACLYFQPTGLEAYKGMPVNCSNRLSMSRLVYIPSSYGLTVNLASCSPGTIFEEPSHKVAEDFSTADNRFRSSGLISFQSLNHCCISEQQLTMSDLMDQSLFCFTFGDIRFSIAGKLTSTVISVPMSRNLGQNVIFGRTLRSVNRLQGLF